MNPSEGLAILTNAGLPCPRTLDQILGSGLASSKSRLIAAGVALPPGTD
jgi:hypothetical protein